MITTSEAEPKVAPVTTGDLPAPSYIHFSDEAVNLKRTALKMIQWLEAGRGVAEWRSVDLSSPGRQWFTPARTEDGAPQPRPHWSTGLSPDVVVESAENIRCMCDVLVREVPVKLKMNGSKAQLKVASAARVQRAMEKAGEGAYWVPGDLTDPTAIIYKPGSRLLTLGEAVQC